MKILTKEEFNNIPDDYKNIYTDYQGKHPNLKGRKTILADFKDWSTGKYPQLMIEGIHFKVV